MIQEKNDILNNQDTNTDLPIAGPVQIQERIEVLDMIRGFALLGILIANMALLSSPAVYFEVLGKNMWTGFWDTAASSFINILIQGKFYTMFSFLFGLGFAIFFERAKLKTASPKLLFYKFICEPILSSHIFRLWRKTASRLFCGAKKCRASGRWICVVFHKSIEIAVLLRKTGSKSRRARAVQS